MERYANKAVLFWPAVATALLFSGSYVAGKFAVSALSPLVATLCRYVVAMVFLLGLSATKFGPMGQVERKDLARFTILALLGIVGYHFFFFVSLRYTDAANTAIINALSPIVTALMAFMFLSERLQASAVAGMLLAVVGVLLLLSRYYLGSSTGFHINAGDACMLVSVACWAGYALIVKTVAGKYSGYTVTMYVTIIGVLLLIPMAAFEIASTGLGAVHASALLSVLYMGIFASGIGYLLYNQSIYRVGATLTSGIVYCLVPIFTAIWGYLLLGERLSFYAAAAVVLIMFGLSVMLGLLRFNVKLS